MEPSQEEQQRNSQEGEQAKTDESKEGKSDQTLQNSKIDLHSMLDRMNECNIMIEVSKHGLCQPVYAKYNNGE